MRSMTPKDFDKLDFPSRLSGLIMQKLGSSGNQNRNNVQSNKMEIENSLTDFINSMKNRLSKSDFDEVISMLTKIFGNIR